MSVQRSIPIVILFVLGCAQRQDYEVIPAVKAWSLLESSKHVVDVTVRHTSRTECVNIPFEERVETLLVLDVDQTVKGAEPSEPLKLYNYRDLRPQERGMFPEGWGFIRGVRLRIGYDRRVGDRFVNLKIVPIGMTPELEWMISASTTRATR
jgi:hypothetical protein